MQARLSTIVCAAAIGVVVACGTQPTAPTPAPLALVKVTALTVTGPARLAPGDSAQFTATAQLSDGTKQDYSQKVAWTSNGNVLGITTEGLATARANGETTISASISGLYGQTNVIVLPVGTFRLTGTVSEAGFGLPEASVVVTAGQGIGFSTSTNWPDGSYRLYGVAGTIDVQVHKDAYTPIVKTITLTHDDVLDFPEMTQTGTLVSFPGAYTLTMLASDDCVALLPVSDRTRTYPAVVTQTGPRVHVALSGANFFLHNGAGNYVDGRLEPSVLFFAFGDPYYYALIGPDVSEILPSGSVLAIDGFVSANLPPMGTHSPVAIEAPFHGTFTEYKFLANGNGQLGQALASCHSENHRFTLTPASATTRRRRP